MTRFTWPTLMNYERESLIENYGENVEVEWFTLSPSERVNFLYLALNESRKEK